MNAAMLLSGLGVSTALCGPHWGSQTRDVLERYAHRYAIDVSGVTRDDTYEGLRDWVLVGGDERLVLGVFGRYFAEPRRSWDVPSARAMFLDPSYSTGCGPMPWTNLVRWRRPF